GRECWTRTIPLVFTLAFVVWAALLTTVPYCIGVQVSENGPRGSGFFPARRTYSSRALSSAVAAGAESASGSDLNGLVSLVVCGSHFTHSSSPAHSESVKATVTTSFGSCVLSSCVARPRGVYAAGPVGPAIPIDPTADSDSSTGTSSTYR